MSKLNNYEIYDKENGNEVSTEVVNYLHLNRSGGF